MKSAMETIYVPEPKLEEMYKKNNCCRIGDTGTCITFFYLNEEWVSVGACSSGNEGIISVWAYRIVPKSSYVGELEPLPYNLHHTRVVEQNLERGYVAMLVTSNKREMVICGPQYEFKKFKAVQVGVQLKLF